VALTEDNDVWWEGLTKTPPAGKIIDWKGNERVGGDSKDPLAHPNSRFTSPASNCPVIDPNWESSEGVPISAIVFGGRRPHTVPLVYEANDWAHGSFIGSSISSQQTAAAEANDGSPRHDPFAMLPFAGYNMMDYWQHWLNIGKAGEAKGNLPKIFHVNWFRQDSDGSFMWPGFGENARVLSWIVDRVNGKDVAQDSPIGKIPKKGTLNTEGLDIEEGMVDRLLEVNKDMWNTEVANLRKFHATFDGKVPQGFTNELDSLEKRLNA